MVVHPERTKISKKKSGNTLQDKALVFNNLRPDKKYGLQNKKPQEVIFSFVEGIFCPVNEHGRSRYGRDSGSRGHHEGQIKR